MSHIALPRSAAKDPHGFFHGGRWARPVKRGVAAGLPLLLTTVACTTGGDQGHGEGDRQDATVVIGADPASLDPAKVTTQADAVLARGLYDTLVRLSARGQIVAGLATSWKQDLKSVSFTLRKGVTCADGSALTPKMVAASINRLADPATKAPSAPLSFGGHKVTAAAGAGQEVTVAVDAPYSGLLVGLSMPWAGIVCTPGLASGASFDQHSYGTGAYTLRSAQRGQNYVLNRRGGYTWGPQLDFGGGKPPAKLTVRVVENESTTANLLIRQQADVAALTGPDADRIKSHRGFQVNEASAGASFVMFNQAPGHPGHDPAVRTAFAQAIDRAAFLRAANNGRGALTSSFVEPDVPCYADDARAVLPGRDLAAAKKVARTVHGAVRIIGTTQLAGGAGTTYLQEALRAAGFTTKLVNRDTTTWADMLYSGKDDWDVTVMIVQNIAKTVMVPASLLFGARPPAGTNLAGITNPDFAAALKTSTSTLGTNSCNALKDAQRSLVKNVDVFPLATLPLQIAHTPGVRVQAPSGLIELGSVRVGS